MKFPKFRFRDKSGNAFPNWDKSSLNDRFVFSTGRGLTKENITSSGNRRCLLYGELFTKHNAIIRENFSLTNVSPKDEKISSGGEVLIPNSDVTPTGLATASCLLEKGVIIGGGINVLTPKNETDGRFVAYLLRSSPKKMLSIVKGTTVRHLHNSDLAKLEYFFPCSEEQQKIAAFFSTLDEKIELSERKLDALERLKKGLMQKIFSQEIRIKDSKGNDYRTWENRNLSDISEPLSYGLNAAASEFDGFHKYLRITDINERTYQYLSANPVSPNVIPEEKYLLKEGDIVFARTGNSVGKTYLYDKNDGDLYYAGFLIRARIRSGICPYFVFLQTQTQKYKNWVKVMSQRSGQPGINAKEYGKYSFLLPCLEEQEKIASLFRLIDSKIFNSLEKINVLKQLKKGFMQQMFV